MVEMEKDKPLWAAYLKREDGINIHRVFVVVKKGTPFETNWFHGKGFWVLEDELEKVLENWEGQSLCEEWIHGNNIDHIKSLMYKER